MSGILQLLLPGSIRRTVKARFESALHKRMRPAAATQLLDRHSVYILPTRYGYIFACVLFAMLMGSINYSNNMGFLLTFYLSGLAMVAIVYTYRNLLFLRFTAGKTKAVFAGDMAEFTLLLQTTNERPAYQIAVGRDRRNTQTADVGTTAATVVSVRLPATKRGRLKLQKVRAHTCFPFGWFHAWSWVAIEAETLVYPKPVGSRRPPPLSALANGSKHSTNRGTEDFAGMRRYQPSDSPAHIAWKALARGHEVLTKQFADQAGETLWLDWDSLAEMDTEQRLSQLCKWVLDLHQQGHRYGLRLPTLSIEPDSGEQQRLLCLEALALFE